MSTAQADIQKPGQLVHQAGPPASQLLPIPLTLNDQFILFPVFNIGDRVRHVGGFFTGVISGLSLHSTVLQSALEWVFTVARDSQCMTKDSTYMRCTWLAPELELIADTPAPVATPPKPQNLKIVKPMPVSLSAESGFPVGARVREADRPERGGVVVATIHASHLEGRTAKLSPDCGPEYLVRWDGAEELTCFVRGNYLRAYQARELTLESHIQQCPQCGVPAIVEGVDGFFDLP